MVPLGMFDYITGRVDKIINIVIRKPSSYVNLPPCRQLFWDSLVRAGIHCMLLYLHTLRRLTESSMLGGPAWQLFLFSRHPFPHLEFHFQLPGFDRLISHSHYMSNRETSDKSVQYFISPKALWHYPTALSRM